jgi:hypothetical protein
MSAWTVIAHTPVGSGGSVITFSNIPNTYTDLFIMLSARGNSPFLAIRFNNSTANRSTKVLVGNGSSSFSRTDTYVGSNITSINNSFTANTFSSVGIYIPNYASSNNKSFSIDGMADSNSTTTWFGNLVSGLWSNSAAISSITLSEWDSGDTEVAFVQYSSATLYGITKGSSGGVTVS